LRAVHLAVSPLVQDGADTGGMTIASGGTVPLAIFGPDN
jgi:hypothetical protein